MNDKKYPIGTKIKYIGYCKKCRNQTGKIIKVYDNTCSIDLPKSTCSATADGRLIMCSWSDIVPLIVKNQQLLFSFMEQENEI